MLNFVWKSNKFHLTNFHPFVAICMAIWLGVNSQNDSILKIVDCMFTDLMTICQGKMGTFHLQNIRKHMNFVEKDGKRLAQKGYNYWMK